MLEVLQQHLAQNLPFLKDKKLLLATSGGIDSMVLVHLFQQLGYDISIAHCNFGLRGVESDGDEQFIRNYASQNNIPSFVTHFDTNTFANDAKVSIQIAARQLRYIWFEELLQEHGLDYLLTAHHLDDSIETFLINFTRGTGLEGLTGIPQQNGNIVRPLLPFGRTQIEGYATQHNIQWREDSSNASDKYLRNKLRHHVVPILKSLNGGFEASFTNTLNHLQQAKSMADDAAALVFKQVIRDYGSYKHIDITQLKRLPNYKAYLYYWLSPMGFTAWDDIYNLADAQPGKYVLSGDYRLLKDRDFLVLEMVSGYDSGIYEIEENVQKTTIPIGLKLENVHYFEQNHTKNIIFVNKELIKFPLFVRKWKEGDYFYPFGMKGLKKKVSKYFKDEKFSLSDKENTWLLCSGEDIIWVVGHRADNRFRVTENTTQILKIAFLQE
ncbi:potassium ABC transporter ATPase [Flavobacterium akiainvivens]|uniref:tRNA(Ile)-lysidine synthase n=1 Tax=Flavobacterium akiainvivens TaxID=1202724 RepID=A0A0M9VH62_9FLAO|nr:tRNA lysidine(34) synthetase TilS [Flavobacterium akiainvivens]KOS05212.1 potassium ABC transporter ATPase [Flavobacterium akiainvivens]SFQ50597.1 tRNA(Ile)-lysidine synthase [Flavobacterium akiainvivens]